MKDNVTNLFEYKGIEGNQNIDLSPKTDGANLDEIEEIIRLHRSGFANIPYTLNNYPYNSELSAGIINNGGEDMASDNNFGILFDELKKDMRERESRTREEISQREKRFEETLKAFQQDSKEREERIYQLINEIKSDNKDLKDEIKSEISLIRSDFTDAKQDISNLTRHNESLATTNKWSNIATIIGISAITVAIFIALFVN